MTDQKQRGRLKTWKDERGFGFITPEDGTQDVFLHATALNPSSRRPVVGDYILYDLENQTNGKLKAVRAKIEGVPSPSQSRQVPRTNSRKSANYPSVSYKTSRTQPNRTQKLSLGGILCGLALLGFAVYDFNRFPNTTPPPINAITQPDCEIKGNISLNSGRRIYHVPGSKDYEDTVIDLSQGERWFCSEAEAKAAGWIKGPP